MSAIAVACVSIAPGASVVPDASITPAASVAPGTSIAPGTSSVPDTAAPSSAPTSEATPAASVAPPTEAPAPTPRRTRRPRPTQAPPTDPPDIDVSVYQYQIIPYTDDPAAGFHVDLNITIQNTGTDKARKFTVAVTCMGYTQEQDVFGGIEGGGQYEISFGFYLSIPGDKANKIVLDSTGRLVETDKENNVHDLSSAPEEYPSSCDREAGNPT